MDMVSYDLPVRVVNAFTEDVAKNGTSCAPAFGQDCVDAVLRNILVSSDLKFAGIPFLMLLECAEVFAGTTHRHDGGQISIGNIPNDTDSAYQAKNNDTFFLNLSNPVNGTRRKKFNAVANGLNIILLGARIPTSNSPVQSDHVQGSELLCTRVKATKLPDKDDDGDGTAYVSDVVLLSECRSLYSTSPSSGSSTGTQKFEREGLSHQYTNTPRAIRMAKREDVREELPQYVPQDPRADIQRSASPTHFQLEDLTGTVLGQRFEVGERLPNENKNGHFVTFTAHQHGVNFRASTDDTGKLVARIYDMNDLTPKHKRYKIRSINRCSARTVFKTTWNSCQIIILRLESSGDLQSPIDIETSQSDNASLKPKTNNKDNLLSLGTRLGSGDNKQLLTSAPLSIHSNAASLESKPSPRPKTNYQRESARLRQRDRRAAKRCQKRSIADGIRAELYLQPRPLSETMAPKESNYGIDDIAFAMLTTIHYAFNPRPELRTQLPPAIRAQITRFLDTRSSKVVFSNGDEKREFVQMKEIELVGLRRLVKKVTGVIQLCHDELDDLIREQGLTTTGSAQWKHLQESFITPRRRWHMVLSSAKKVLPELITESEELVSSLRSELIEAKELEEKKRLLNYKDWIYHFIPGSDTFHELFGALENGESGVPNIRGLSNDHHLEQDRSDEDFSEWFDYDKYYNATEQGTSDKTSVVLDGLSDASPAVAGCEALHESLDGYNSPQQLLDPATASRPLFSAPLLTRNATPDHVLSPAFSSPSSSQNSSTQPSQRSASRHASSSPSASTSSQTSTSLSNAHSCSICNEPQLDVERWIDHLALRHPETTSNVAKPYFCGRQSCSRFKLRKDFKRHLTNTPIHSDARWHCRCGRAFSRKDNFRNHYQEMTCAPTTPFRYVCSCGHNVDCRKGNALAIFEAHFRPCGQLPRGRPRKR
ncbi:hypothetical protein F4803DRAFT_551764 [Xylaria telfairii]|nr:hypothetical protein F4803DRAFT_551764 [Xylaria telfairii]